MSDSDSSDSDSSDSTLYSTDSDSSDSDIECEAGGVTYIQTKDLENLKYQIKELKDAASNHKVELYLKRGTIMGLNNEIEELKKKHVDDIVSNQMRHQQEIKDIKKIHVNHIFRMIDDKKEENTIIQNYIDELREKLENKKD